MSVLKIEPYSGLSGDMFLGALCGLTHQEAELQTLPEKLGLEGVSVQIRPLKKNSILCTKVDIIDEAPPKARTLTEIQKLIRQAQLSSAVQERALSIFQLVGEAEAMVHGISIEKVHFHEVGAIDSIMDIVGAAFLLEALDFERVYSAPLCTGFGLSSCEHGRLPIPTPATEILLRGMPTYRGTTESELVTPTGAAILKSLKPLFEAPDLIGKVAHYGAGTKDFDHPNALRLSLAEPRLSASTVLVLQCNLDNVIGEHLGQHFQEGLLARGALDFSLCPIQMKKSRPGLLLEVLCAPSDQERLVHYILEQTPTLGVRHFPVERTVLERKAVQLNTRWGKVDAKAHRLPSGQWRYTPEYESCRKIADQTNTPFPKIHQNLHTHLMNLGDGGPTSEN